MVQINNQAVIQKLIDELKLYPATGGIPTELAEKILPVYQINAEDITVAQESTTIVRTLKTNTIGGETLYTTSATEQFFLTGLTLQAWYTGMASNQNATISAFINGVNTVIAHLNHYGNMTAPAVISHDFQNPIKVDKGTIIEIEWTSNSPSSGTAIGTIFGYEK